MEDPLAPLIYDPLKIGDRGMLADCCSLSGLPPILSVLGLGKVHAVTFQGLIWDYPIVV